MKFYLYREAGGGDYGEWDIGLEEFDSEEEAQKRVEELKETYGHFLSLSLIRGLEIAKVKHG